MVAKRKSNIRSHKQAPNGQELLLLELREIHNAETQLSNVMPRLSKSAESRTLKQMLDARLTEGERIIGDIETVLNEMDGGPKRKKNVAAEGLIADAREHVQEIASGPALDAVLIGAMQKTEHYCIAAWGTARALAQTLGEKSAVRSMDRALKQGKRFDEKLTRLAEREVTPALLAQVPEAQAEGQSRNSTRSSRRASA